MSVTPLGASNVLAVTAQASNPTDAAEASNAFAANSIRYRGSVVQYIATTLSSLSARLAQLPAASAEAQSLATTVSQLRHDEGPRPRTDALGVTAGAAARWHHRRLEWADRAVRAGRRLRARLRRGARRALETFTRPVRDRAEVLSVYDLPVLAAVPKVRDNEAASCRRGSSRRPPSSRSWMLRVQLTLGKRGRVIMVTSAGAGDGKTTVAAALAAAFAEVDDRVVLMDLDMRKPELTGLSSARSLRQPTAWPRRRTAARATSWSPSRSCRRQARACADRRSGAL